MCAHLGVAKELLRSLLWVMNVIVLQESRIRIECLLKLLLFARLSSRATHTEPCISCRLQIYDPATSGRLGNGLVREGPPARPLEGVGGRA